MKRRRGYTLLELMVATAMGATLMAVAAGAFITAMDGRSRLEAHGAARAALRRAYEVLARDIHSATLPPDDSGVQFGLDLTAGGGAADVLRLAAVVGEPLLTPRPANETVLVEYAIAENPRTGRPAFWRFATPYPVVAGPGTDGDTRALPLLDGVVDAEYAFFSESQANWLTTWEGEPGLPTAIRVDLYFGEDEGGRAGAQRETWIFQLPAGRYAAEEAVAAAEAAQAAESGASR
jgi:prepilin-type N-terminal cleavage/methylation domain-containing protein